MRLVITEQIKATQTLGAIQDLNFRSPTAAHAPLELA